MTLKQLEKEFDKRLTLAIINSIILSSDLPIKNFIKWVDSTWSQLNKKERSKFLKFLSKETKEELWKTM